MLRTSFSRLSIASTAALVVLGFALVPARVARDVQPASESGAVKMNVAPKSVVKRTVDEAHVEAFETWVERYVASEPDERRAMVSEGRELARVRRHAMASWIVSDPRKAVEHAVGAERRAQLPADVVAQLENLVEDTGRLFSTCATKEEHVCEEGHAIEIGTRAYSAHLFGRRAAYRQASELAVHGVEIDGRMAVWDSPVRVLDARPDGSVEVATAGRRVVVESFAEAYALESDLRREEHRVAFSADVATTPDASGVGRKRYLVLNVDFPDREGALAGPDELRAFFDEVGDFFLENSYGRLEIDFEVDESVIRLPYSASEYVASHGPFGLSEDAIAAADARHDVGSFDCVIFLFKGIAPSSPGNFYWAGLGGGGRVWVNGTLRLDLVAHEIGHHLGVGHASAWVPADGDPVSRSGASIAYGDPADVMSIGAGGVPGHFNPVFKRRMGWLPDESVTEVRESGVYRIHGYDEREADTSRPVALKLFRGQRDLWVSFRRQRFPHLPAYATGATILRADLDGYKVEVLDVNTPGVSVADSPLSPGQEFVDTKYGVRIRALARDGVGADEYMDFQVTVDPLPDNVLVDYGATFSVVDEDTIGVERFSAGVWTSLAVHRDGRVSTGGLSVLPGMKTVPSDIGHATIVDAKADDFGVTGAVNSEGRGFVWGPNTQLRERLPAVLSGVRGLSVGGDRVALWDVWGGVNVFAVGNDTASSSTLAGARGDVVQLVATRSDVVVLSRDGTISTLSGRSGWDTSEFRDLAAIAVAETHVLGLRRDGTVVGFAWDGADATGAAAVPAGLSRVRRISADDGLSAALTEDGRLVRWGILPEMFALPRIRIVDIDVKEGHSVLLLGEGKPHFTVHPASFEEATSGPVYLTAFATGGGRLSYAWEYRRPGDSSWTVFQDGESVSGARTPSIMFDRAASDMRGWEIRCVATDKWGRATASAAAGCAVRGDARPVVVGPSTWTAGNGFELVAATSVAGEFRWYRNGVLVSGVSGPTLRVGASEAADGGRYSVEVATSFGVFRSEYEHVVEVVAGPPAAQSWGRLVNLSARGYSGLGDGTMIVGFVHTGGETAGLAFQAIGPGLRAFGVEKPLEEPRYELRDSQGAVITTSDAWASAEARPAGDAAVAAVGGTPSRVNGDAPAADLRLPAGLFTIRTWDPRSEGVVLVELFEEIGNHDGRLVNLSARGTTGVGERVLIAGFVVEDGPLPVLVRAVGTGVAANGVEGVADDPSLVLYAADGAVVADNESWTSDSLAVEDAAKRSGAFPLLHDSDAALVVVLEPGSYTAHARNASGREGVVLLEIYDAR
jgi:hypothetical protein